MRVGVVGQTARDLISGPEGGAPAERLGGAPVYSARALRFAGHEPVVVAKGPRLDGAVNLPATGTFVSRLELLAGGLRQTIEATGDPFTAREAVDAILPALAGCRWALLGGQTAGDFPPETIAALVDAGLRVIVDAQGLARGPDPGPVRLRPFALAALDGATAVKLNEDEAQALGVGRDERALRRLGLPEVVVTLGERGALVVADGESAFVAPTAPPFANPPGAGDSWAALYAAARSAGVDPGASAEQATHGVEALYGGAGPGAPIPAG